MLFSADGLVTRVIDTGGSEKYIHIVTPDRGRICVSVKGGKSLKGNQTACSQLFTYGNFEIYTQNDRNWLRGGSVLTPFYELSESITKMALASYICELTEEFTDEGDDDASQVLRLALNSLYALCRDIKPEAQIKAVLEIRLAALSGYCPDLSGCCECGMQNVDSMYFDVMNGNIVCAECLEKRSASAKLPIGAYADEMREATVLSRINQTVLGAVRYALTSPVQKMLTYEISDAESLELFGQFAETYVLSHLGRGFNSLDFYKVVKK